MEFLGCVINSEGCQPFPTKLQTVVTFHKLRTVVELRRFLGLVNF